MLAQIESCETQYSVSVTWPKYLTTIVTTYHIPHIIIRSPLRGELMDLYVLHYVPHNSVDTIV